MSWTVAGVVANLFETDENERIEADWTWLSRFPDLDDTDRQLLMVALERKAVRNEDVRNISTDDVLGASRRLSRLRDKGLLVQHGTNKQRTWYSLSQEAQPSHLDANLPTSNANLPTSETKPSNLGDQTFQPRRPNLPTSETKPSNLPMLSPELQAQVNALPRKVSRTEMKALILELCREAWWEPRQLAELLERHTKYITTFLKPLHREGRLCQLYPENKHHPHQAYRATDAQESTKAVGVRERP